MERTRKAVDTPVLTPPIWVHCPIERHIRCPAYLVDDRLRLVCKHLPLHTHRFPLRPFLNPLNPLSIKLLSEHMQAHRLEPIPGIDPRSAPMNFPLEQPIPIAIVLVSHTKHNKNMLH